MKTGRMQRAPTVPRTETPFDSVASGSGSNTVQRLGSRWLLVEEAARARTFGIALAMLTLVALALLPVLGGTPWLKAVFAGALLSLAGMSLYVAWRARSPLRYTPALFRTFGAVAVSTSYAAQYYLGVFSPTPLAITLGLVFFGQGTDRRGALTIGITAVSGYFVLTGLIVLGVIPDLGVVDATGTAPTAKVFMLVLVPIVQGLTLWQTWANRMALHEGIDSALEVQRVAVQQQSRFEEVRRELEAKLRLAEGDEGRYTGERIGDWQVGPLIGRGGMGDVYRAEGVESRRLAAVKFLRAQHAGDATSIRRFEREWQIASQLRSPHVVQVFDYGLTDDGVPYLAMELLSGRSLGDVLRDGGSMSGAQVHELASAVGRGLDDLHAAGVIHRDIKPQNIFRVDAGAGRHAWRIVDFGIARMSTGHGTLTAGDVVGTPAYMAPEQASGDEVDERTDLYALGAVLYRALVGSPPVFADQFAAAVYQVVFSRPTRPRDLNPTLHRQIEAMLSVAMAPNPELRFATGGEMAAALGKAMRGELGSALRRRARSVDGDRPWRRLDQAARQLSRPERRAPDELLDTLPR